MKYFCWKNQLSLVLILALFDIVYASKEVDLTAKFLNALIQNEKIPTVLNIRSCYSQRENIRLSQLIDVPIQLNNHLETVNLTVGDSTNKIWFIIKMDCSRSLDFLQKVPKSSIKY
jgi:hypothetical protein